MFFRYDSRIKIYNGLSKDFLLKILPQIHSDIPCLLFLDAHFPGADLKKSNFSDEKNEDIRMPLYDELLIIKELRVKSGAKDVIIIDDIMLYDDENEYEASHQKKSMDILPLKHRNFLKKFIDLFKDTHNFSLLKSEQGWLIFTPK